MFNVKKDKVYRRKTRRMKVKALISQFLHTFRIMILIMKIYFLDDFLNDINMLEEGKKTNMTSENNLKGKKVNSSKNKVEDKEVKCKHKNV